MVIVQIIKGDILQSNSKIIAQQNNCVTTKSHGFSEILGKKYPYANIYSFRTNKIGSKNNAQNPDIPGTIKIYKETTTKTNNNYNNPIIICMLAQYLPGKPYSFSKYYDNKFPDSYKDREYYFQKCLDLILEQGIEEVSMPYSIGCGLAGGNWEKYSKMLDDSKIKITLYQL